MSGIIKLCVLFIAFAALVASAACTKLCASGYEGNTCNIEVRTKFEGIWSAIDTPGSLAYKDTISPVSSISGVSISPSFAQNYFVHSIHASVSGTTISIPLQQPDSVNHLVQGTGVIDKTGHTIQWSYQLLNSVDSPEIITNFIGTWTK
jgi:hypothetical protein